MYSFTALESADPKETGCRLPQHRRQQHGSTRRGPSHCRRGQAGINDRQRLVNTQCEHTAVVVCTALRRWKARTQRRLVAVSLNIGDDNTARPSADPSIVPLWPGNTSQARQAWVQWFQKSRVSPLINTDTYITAVQFLSARYCCSEGRNSA